MSIPIDEIPDLKTQKAKGIQAIARSPSDYFSTSACYKATVWPHAHKLPMFPFFARPCPMRPRHGFLDSRVVDTVGDWDRLIAEIEATKLVNVEVVCMPFIDADWSAILTEGGLTVGPGNDGATSGNGSLTIPSGNDRLELKRVLMPASFGDASIRDSPYFEIVHDVGFMKAELVQIRDGPKVALGSKFVPEPFTVKRVVKAGGDLMEWEAAAKKFKSGTYVWHPGGNLSSHYAVHCIINKIPITCQPDSPTVGDEISTENVSPSLSKSDYVEIASHMLGVGTAISGNFGLVQSWCETGIGVLHASAGWGNDGHLLRLRGCGAGAIMYLAAAACMGEDRHYYTTGPGRNGKRKSRLSGIPFRGISSNAEREEVFQVAFKHDILTLGQSVRAAYYDFRTRGWRHNMGGKNWALCAKATLKYISACGRFIVNPCENTWIKVMGELNAVIHIAHNGGYLLDKFTSRGHFKNISMCPSLGFANPVAVDIAFGKMSPMPEMPKDYANQLKNVARLPRGARGAGITYHLGAEAQ